MPSKPATRLALVALVVGASSLAALWALPYSRCEMTTIEVADEARAPGADSFALGPIEFDLAAYRTAPELEPFREFRRRSCDGVVEPVALTACLISAAADAFPHGTPSVEFMNAGYVPSEALARHLAGERGHCVTRSGLIVATLLATGTPARVVQWCAVGHTMLEVWSGEEWLVVDPTSGVMITGTPHTPALESDLPIALAGRSARPIADMPEGGVSAATCFAASESGARVYLEPWLYTRVGPRAADFPYPEAAAVAAPSLAVGYGQPAAAMALLLAAIAGLAAAVRVAAGRVAARQSSERVARVKAAGVSEPAS